MSSISGFSTNSHLEDGADDNTQSSSSLAVAAGGGGARDDKKNDPFASTSSAGGSDLFSAFSIPTSSSDPFFSGGGANAFTGKPSDVSAFDPFGITDPFKVQNYIRVDVVCGVCGAGEGDVHVVKIVACIAPLSLYDECTHHPTLTIRACARTHTHTHTHTDLRLCH